MLIDLIYILFIFTILFIASALVSRFVFWLFVGSRFPEHDCSSPENSRTYMDGSSRENICIVCLKVSRGD